MSAFASLDLLEKHLSTRSYITGYALSADDTKELKALTGGIPAAASYPNVYRWGIHIVALTGINTMVAAGGAAPAKKAATEVKQDDFDDMFGDDDDEVNEDGETAAEAAATKARRERMEHARKLKEERDAKDGKVKKAKAKEVEKSLVVLEVKPWEADTDLEMVWKKIIEYKQEGLSWGVTFNLEPVAYGVKKLVMTCSIVDSLVLMDDITDNIEKLDEYVQSVQVVSMNKI